ncbi:MAG: ABC transporter substrate-binding protein [Acidobacteria bacterium]|nr:ABC transporter substrate-binding protein [Acidobacteriota bacterium]
MILRGLLTGFLTLAFASVAAAEDRLRIGVFSRDAVSFVAEGKGFLRQEGIHVEYALVRASVELMRNFVDGKFDLIHTTADNVIAWAEGQGADPQKHDFVIFIGGRKGLALELVAAPGISSVAGFKGKILAVDAINTGYAPVLVYMLKKQGLTLGKDYTVKPVGGTGARLDALLKGEAAGGFVPFTDDLKRKGFRLLARSQDTLPNYAVGIGAARGDWAGQHEELLVRYIRALVRSIGWLLETKNKTEAIQIFRSGLGDSLEQARQLYEESFDPKIGVIPRGKIDPRGIQTVLDLRELMGEMKAPLPSPDKYIAEHYYEKAIATLAGPSAGELRK